MKQTYELIAPCHFGLEAVLKKEILDLGYEISQVEDGRVTFIGDDEAICRANVFLRTAERILLKAGSFRAETFEELFQGTKAIAWEEFIPEDGKFWVAKASSIKSKLFSPSDIQSIMKKAMVERMKEHYHVSWFPEDGAKFPLRVFLYKDIVTIGIDTSGDSLHKRGYRTLTSKAPITETLAAALIMLTPWNKDRILVDPFCGSGTIPIEAAMMAARANAQSAGVDHMIHFQQRPVNALSHPKKYGFIISNPPYGERIEEKKNLPALYTEIGERFAALDAWSMYLITSYEDAEKYIGRKADKNRKIYNGMLKTYFYQFMGPRPPKRSQENRNVD